MSKCEKCGVVDNESNNNSPHYNMDFYWHGDIEEDYDMGEYNCLCPDCFGNAEVLLIKEY
tara:strand:- start:10408 stop:10587 length:180 start_codon:yes stop_codon:yes gene_type:complete